MLLKELKKGRFLPTTPEDLIDFSIPEDRVKKGQTPDRWVLLRCAARMVEQKKLMGVKFTHRIYPRSFGAKHTPTVIVLNTTMLSKPFPSELVAVGKNEIAVNGCVSLNPEGIRLFEEKKII